MKMSTSGYALTDEEQEYLAEREAIAVYDGGVSQEEARILAYTCYVKKYRPQFKDYYPLTK